MAFDWLGEAELVNSIKVPVDDEDDREVEVYVLNDNAKEQTETLDPFLTTKTDGMPSNLKRKASYQLRKAATTDTGGSKQNYPEQLTAYDLLQVVTPPYDLYMLAKLYELNAAHNAAVTMKSVNIVGLGWDWVFTDRTKLELSKIQPAAQPANPNADPTKPTPGSKKYQAQLYKFETEKLDLREQFEALCQDETFQEIMVKIWTDVESIGNGYLEVGATNTGKINFLGHIPGHTMRVRASRDGFIQMVANKYVYFRNFGDAKAPNPLGNDTNPNQIMHFKKYSPNSTYYGVPDIIAALPATLGDKFAKEYNLDYFENKTVPRYAFILKGAKLSAKAEQNLVNYFKNELKGKHHGTLYVPIPAGFGQQVDAEFKPIEVGAQQASFIEYIRENRLEILMVHRVPPGKVGIHEKTNLAVSRDADKTFKEQVCEPEQERVENKVNKIVATFTKDFKLKFKEADLIDADIQSRIHDRYLRTQVITPNDVLQDLGKPTRPDGDTPLPYQVGRNEGGPGQKTSDGANPTRNSPASVTGQRQERGQAQDAGRKPAPKAQVSTS